jgi:nitrous oxidase accessory protein NosD
VLRPAELTGIGLLATCAILAGPLASGSQSRGADAVADQVCDRVAVPSGRAHARYGAVGRLVRSLRPGETGCLRRGTYVEDVGVSRSRITLRSYPGERARIVGRLWFRRAAHDVVVSDLVLDGRNDERLPSPTVNGDRIRFLRVEVTNRHTSICFNIGSERYGRASGTVIQHSRIHSCGRLPARNTGHGIYVSSADDTRIVGNLVYDNADRGIQLFPDAQGTRIAGNVIDGNGEGIIFSGAGGDASSDNVVEHNVIANSRIRADVESWYPHGNPVGVGNVVRENCLFGGRGGLLGGHGRGYVAVANVFADPRYADRAAGDFRLSPGGPCARILSLGGPHPAADPEAKLGSRAAFATGIQVVSHRAVVRPVA